MGHALMRLIYAFAAAPEDAKIFEAKWDVTDGFWTMVVKPGEEWNFAFVLPQEEGKPIKIVVPTSVQMGWIESPAYFCTGSETARDVADDYIETPIGSLPPHKLQPLTEEHPDFQALPDRTNDDLSYLTEVYVDDFMSLAIATSKEQLRHVSTAIMKGIHDVWEESDTEAGDTISVKKIRKGEGHWALQKELLGFDFDGSPGEHTIWLAEKKREALLLVLHDWIRGAAKRKGVPFKDFESVVQKIRHAFTSLPAGKGLLTPLNDMVTLAPATVFLHKNEALLTAVRDCRTLIKETMVSPTKCSQLVQGWPDYIGIKDASGHGVGGVVVGEGSDCVPTVFRLAWPPDIQKEIVSQKNPDGKLTNSDLEMAGLLLLFLVMESVCKDLRPKHVALFSDNTPTVSWVRRMAVRRSKVAAQLVRALALRMAQAQCSPLTPLHVAGKQNDIADIPSRSFGSEPKWFCETDDDLRTLFNNDFPLPQQNSWTVFRVSPEISTRVISVLRMRLTSLAEWRRLKPIGTHTGAIGATMSGLWESTLGCKAPPTTTASAPSRDSPPEHEPGSTASDAKSRLIQYQRRSRPLARRSPWPSSGTRRRPNTATNGRRG
ncbi:hypothetical protein ACHAWF_013086 [Thalassiosira exigua]